MRNLVIGTLVLLVGSLFAPATFAQTCSCASVPLLGSMESASPNDKQWYLASTYEFHDVSDLVAGSSSVPDTTGRDRTAQAFIVEASRGLSDKWSVSALLAVVDHEREVGAARATASGLGDAILMLKYAPKSISLYSDTALSFGIGSRLPVGVDDAKQNGITLAEDMQPSMGSYAGMAWVYWAKALNESKGARIYASASHTINGDNDRDYMFGNDSTVSFGGSYQTATPWGFNLELLYRNADRDQRDSVDIPNTGGEWLDIIPTVQYHVTETLAIRASAKVPLERDLNDQLQFTTKYAFRLTLSYVFGGNTPD
jgi:hypothetical protein